MGTIVLSAKSPMGGKVFPKTIRKNGKVFHLHAISSKAGDALREIAVQKIRGFKILSKPAFVTAVYRRK